MVSAVFHPPLDAAPAASATSPAAAPVDMAGLAAEFDLPPLPDLEQSDPSPDAQAELQQQLATLRLQAEQQGQQLGYADGQQKGYEAGFQSGLEEGRQQGLLEAQQQQQPLTAHWQQLVTEFQHTLDALDSVIASRLMQLALTAAKQVLGQPPVYTATASLQINTRKEQVVVGQAVLSALDAEAARARIEACFASADHAEGLAAQKEKRSPRFEGR